MTNHHAMIIFLDKDVGWKEGMVGMAPWKRTQTHIIMESVDK